MVSFGSGLIITEQLTQRNVSVDLKFTPSIGILARRVDKLGADIRSFREPLRQAVKEVVIPSIRRNFDVGGRPKWEPLSATTLRIRGGSSKPLVRSGRLRREMGYLKIWDIDREKAMITDLPDSIWYGKVHQGGAQFSVRGTTGPADLAAISKALSYGNRKRSASAGTFGDSAEIPARPFVVLQKGDLNKIDRIFTRWVNMRVRAAGL